MDTSSSEHPLSKQDKEAILSYVRTLLDYSSIVVDYLLEKVKADGNQPPTDVSGVPNPEQTTPHTDLFRREGGSQN